MRKCVIYFENNLKTEILNFEEGFLKILSKNIVISKMKMVA